MQFRRSGSAAGAVAVVAAVAGNLIGGAPGAFAAPSPHTPFASAPHALSGRHGVPHHVPHLHPPVYPRPQSMLQRGRSVSVTRTVTVVAGPGADRPALDVISEALRTAGARRVDTVDAGTPLPADGLAVYVEGPGAAAALRALKAPVTGDLPAGGYVLASGRAAVGGGDGGRARDVVALSGSDADGTFHGAQTLRQLAAAGAIPGVAVRDWPVAAVRGTVEGFYGEPWTWQQRLEHVDFLARTKQNRYLYAPGDDPYRGARWRDEYPPREGDRLRALAERARQRHVTLAWAVSPGQSMCLSSAEDRAALTGKLESLWRLGVRGFQLQFQDVSYDEWHCDEDAETYGTGPAAAARAQAEVANEVAARLAERHGGAVPISVLPTEFYQDGSTRYRRTLAGTLAPGVEVAWTGVGVVPSKITGGQLAEARDAFRHPLVTMDNYPVNDFAQDRVFLGPYTGRDPAIATASAELLANAMRQPIASRVALFTAADFAWNPRGYDAAASWRAALRDLAGGSAGARDALAALAGNSASSPLGQEESAYLRPLLRRFWAALDGGDQRGLEDAADRLSAAFQDMSRAPGGLASVADGALNGEVRPWLEQLTGYGEAGHRAVDMLVAQARGDGTAAWHARLAVDEARRRLAKGTATVGTGVLDPFLDRALASADGWTGVRADGRTAQSTLGSARGFGPSRMIDGRQSTYYWSEAPPQPGDAFGVDLGSAQPVREVRIEMGAPRSAGGAAHGAAPGAAPGAADDYLRDAVLEYADGDGGGWRRIRAYRDQGDHRTLTARLPEGTDARRIRLRATEPQPTRVAVRTFSVTGPDSVRPEVSGSPAALPGSPQRSAADGDPATAYRAAAEPSGDGSAGPGALTVRFRALRPLAKVTVLTGPDAGVRASVEAHVPGQGWRTLGDLRDGWTELAAHGAKADAVRLSWAPGSRPPVVYEVVPWFADAPAARLGLSRTEVDAEIGGAPASLTADVAAARADAAKGKLAVRAPKGIRVAAPRVVALRRGGKLSVPVKITVPEGTPPGEYPVVVRFTVDGESVVQRALVRAYPRTGGRDLARGARAASSGDETRDFPASAITDGDPETRWSSPAEDGAWVQVELPEPARVGRVVLRWEEAYASGYRIQTSPDGWRWTTAATVREGRGGTEEVRMDAPGTRFLRIQGVQRATKFGYSLYAVETYAVAKG